MIRTVDRNVRVLATCQALYTASISIDMTLTALVGYQMASNKTLATIPFSLITVGAAVTAIFASLLMRRVGRRAGFALGGLAGATGGVVSVWAIFHHSFVGFCLGTSCVGVFQAFAQYYRYAAADAVPQEYRSRVISTVLAGGLIAAVLGPLLATWTKDLFAPVQFAGSYLVVTVFGLATAALLATVYRDDVVRAASPAAAAERGSSTGRPLSAIVRQPVFIAALTNTVLGFAVMMLVMTATPLAVVYHHHSIADGASVIQWHLVGMYAPSFFTGRLIERTGVTATLLVGSALSAAAALIAMSGSTLWLFVVALCCLGVGWNFMYVGGTTLLTRAYLPKERAKTQAANEFSVLGTSAVASFFGGSLLTAFGWSAINLGVLPLLAVAAGTTVWYTVTERRVRVARALSA